MATFPLKQGSKGATVKTLQIHLNIMAELYKMPDRLGKDGDFGPGTENLLEKIYFTKEVSHKFGRTMTRFAMGAAKRLKSVRAGRPNVDYSVRRYFQTEAGLFYSLLRIYDLAHRLKDRGVDLTPYKHHLQEAWDISVRQYSRQKRIIQNTKGSITYKYAYKKAYQTLLMKYAEHKGIGTIGELRLGGLTLGRLAMIATGGIIGQVIAGKQVIEETFGGYGDAKREWKKSKKIEAILAKLSPEDKAALEKDVNEQINDAYDDGKSKGTWGTLGKIIKPLLLFGGGFWLFNKFVK